MIKNKTTTSTASFRLIAFDDQPCDDNVSMDGDDENRDNENAIPDDGMDEELGNI